MQVKVCGIQNLQEMNLAIEAGADALGFVSQMPSGPYQLSLEQIRELGRAAPSQTSNILLTSKSTSTEILRDLEYVGFNQVQVCQILREDEYDNLRRRSNLKIYQSIHIFDRSAIDCAVRITPYVDFVILDSGTPNKTSPQLGGTGKVHDWSVSVEVVKLIKSPVFLAGGLNPTNLQAALQSVRPYGLDVCSGVRSGGQIDLSLLRSFLRLAKCWAEA